MSVPLESLERLGLKALPVLPASAASKEPLALTVCPDPQAPPDPRVTEALTEWQARKAIRAPQV